MRNTDFVVTLLEGKSNPNHVTVAVCDGTQCAQAVTQCHHHSNGRRSSARQAQCH